MELTKTDIQMEYSKEKTYIKSRCMEEYLNQALEILIWKSLNTFHSSE
jgi:hypothetical protein